MTQFSIDTFTTATCTHVNKHVQLHGDTQVHCKDLNWRIDGPNTLLDQINPGLRPALYKHASSKPIPGVEDITPELRTGLFEGPFHVKYEGSGYMLTIKYGEVSGEQIELAGTELAKMKIDPRDGGSVSLFFRSSHVGLGMGEMGRLDTFDGKELSILLAPPALQSGTPSDSKKKPKDVKTKPLEFEAGAPPVDVKDATQVFTETHGKPAKKMPAKPVAKKAAAKKTNGAKPKADESVWPSGMAYGHAEKVPPHLTEPKVSKASRKRMKIGE